MYEQRRHAVAALLTCHGGGRQAGPGCQARVRHHGQRRRVRVRQLLLRVHLLLKRRHQVKVTGETVQVTSDMVQVTRPNGPGDESWLSE